MKEACNTRGPQEMCLCPDMSTGRGKDVIDKFDYILNLVVEMALVDSNHQQLVAAGAVTALTIAFEAAEQIQDPFKRDASVAASVTDALQIACS